MKNHLSLYALTGAFLLIAVPRSVGADVVDSSPAGFAIQFTLSIDASPAKVYQHLVNDIAKWWESSHTYSGDAANLYVEAEAKGWFGERLPDGGTVQHMEVLFAAPGKLLRLRGALGPLQEYAITGTMSWVLTEEGRKTNLKLVYYVGGYRPGGLDDFAVPVDRVVGTQAARLKRFCETGDPAAGR